ncbi:MAG: hypothetical protein WAT89_00685 [Candidatus Kapaibacterium sp.]
MKKSIITISIFVLIKILMYNSSLAQFAPSPVVFVTPSINQIEIYSKQLTDSIPLVLIYKFEINTNDILNSDLLADEQLGIFKNIDSILCNTEKYKVIVLAQNQNYKVDNRIK